MVIYPLLALTTIAVRQRGWFVATLALFVPAEPVDGVACNIFVPYRDMDVWSLWMSIHGFSLRVGSMLPAAVCVRACMWKLAMPYLQWLGQVQEPLLTVLASHLNTWNISCWRNKTLTFQLWIFLIFLNMYVNSLLLSCRRACLFAILGGRARHYVFFFLWRWNLGHGGGSFTGSLLDKRRDARCMEIFVKSRPLLKGVFLVMRIMLFMFSHAPTVDGGLKKWVGVASDILFDKS